MRAILCGALMMLTASTASVQQVQSQERAVKPQTAKPSAPAPSGGPSRSEWRNQVIGILVTAALDAAKNHLPGAVHLAFTIDRQGRVISARIDHSSGSAALDAEALALVHRVRIPRPPAEITAPQISLVVWLVFR